MILEPGSRQGLKRCTIGGTVVTLASVSLRRRACNRMSQQWYAVRVKSNREKVVSSSLAGKGYESFLPLYRSRRQWADRRIDIDIPLFSGYVFCRLDPAERLPVLTTPGVMVFVGFGKDPMPVEETEIE